MIKIIGLEKAVADFNKWEEYARILFDTESGEVWTDVFFDREHLKEYPGSNIFKVATKKFDCEHDLTEITVSMLNLLLLTIYEHTRPVLLTLEISRGVLTNVTSSKKVLTKLLDWDNIELGDVPCEECEIKSCESCSYPKKN